MSETQRNAELILLRRGGTQAWRVVIADDEVLSGELLERMLLRMGHQVVGTAQNGADAVTLARELLPDVVLMDLRMPVTDGWTAMTELTRDLIAPVVAVSALDDRESLELAARAGASAFLPKPVREADLERALDAAVTRFADVREIQKWRAEAEQRAQAQSALADELARVTRERDALRQALVVTARRAAMVSLVRSLTHDMNNALTPIVACAQLIAFQYKQDADTQERTRQIVEYAQRIAGWTGMLRQISSEARAEPIVFSFNGILQDVLQLYRERFARKEIVVAAEFDEQVPPMRGYPEVLQEMFVNFFHLAAGGMRNGDQFQVHTLYVETENSVLTVLTHSGASIAPENLPFLMEPNFSDARFSADDFLRWVFWSAHEIVKTHGGTFEVTSPVYAAQRGARIQIWLPVQARVAA